LSHGIGVDVYGSAYVVGDTTSTDFPVTANGLQTTNAGGSEGFFVKLNPQGTDIAYGTYIGGSNDDSIAGIALSGSGTIYIAGTTLSNNFLGGFHQASQADAYWAIAPITVPAPPAPPNSDTTPPTVSMN